MSSLRPFLLPRCQLLPRLLHRKASTAVAWSPMDAKEKYAQHDKKRQFKSQQNNRRQNKKQKKSDTEAKQGSHEEVLLYDVQALLKQFSLRNNTSSAADQNPGTVEESESSRALPEPKSEVQLTISEISSVGDGLAFDEKTQWTYVVPFTIPGDVVLAKVVRHLRQEGYSITDLIKVNEPSKARDDSLISCKYFAKCSGCQFQMLPYKDQLAHKKTIVEKAYKNFSDLDPSLVPEVLDTMGSPLQYGYRTKLTPHFDGPPGSRRDRRHGKKPIWDSVPPIGFMLKGTRHTLDIEDCPIGTAAVRMGMKNERARVTRDIDTYQRGATLLLREDTRRISKNEASQSDVEKAKQDPNMLVEDHEKYINAKSCITNQTATSREFVDDFIFENPAGAFFQNNNSILPPFTQYIRDNILPKVNDSRKPAISYLIDAYSGSGLFTITLSQMFKKSIGIDISASSIEFANKNARLNNLPPDQASFIAADAGALFAEVTFPAAETVVVIDPPRKGCDENFLSQLVRFGPERIVYVSCNVHTQARDVGMLVGGMDVNDKKGSYEIESLRGFDFFPQTGHVEGVAVLRKKSESASNSIPATSAEDAGAKVEVRKEA